MPEAIQCELSLTQMRDGSFHLVRSIRDLFVGSVLPNSRLTVAFVLPLSMITGSWITRTLHHKVGMVWAQVREGRDKKDGSRGNGRLSLLRMHQMFLLPTGSEVRGVLGVGSIPVAILPSCQNMKTFAL